MGRCSKKLKIKLFKNYWSISIVYIDFKLISVLIYLIRNGWLLIGDGLVLFFVFKFYTNVCDIIILERGIL